MLVFGFGSSTLGMVVVFVSSVDVTVVPFKIKYSLRKNFLFNYKSKFNLQDSHISKVRSSIPTLLA